MDDHLLYDEDQQKMRIDDFFEDFVPKGVDTLDRVNALLKALNIVVDVEHDLYNAKKNLYYYGRSKFTFDVTSSKLANRDTERVNESRVYMIDALKCWDPKKETFNLKKLVKRQLPEFLGGPKLEPAVIRDGNVNGGGATSSSKKTKHSVDPKTLQLLNSMNLDILEGIRVGYGIYSNGKAKDAVVRVIADSLSDKDWRRNANCHVGRDRKIKRDDPKLALYTLSEYIGCWNPKSKTFDFSKKDPELTPEPLVETPVKKSTKVQHQSGSTITAVPRSVRNKHVLNMSDPGTSTSISVTDKAKTRPRFVSATSSTKSDDKASDAPVEMTSNGSDNKSTSNSSENDGSAVPEEHVLHIYLCEEERPGYQTKEYIPDREGIEEYRVVMNRKHLENWQNGIDSFAPEVQVDPPEGKCWRCGAFEWGYNPGDGLSCKCSDFDKANRPGPNPRVCTKEWPKQFTYPGEHFGCKMATTERMEEHREAENQKLFEAWYKKRYDRFLL